MAGSEFSSLQVPCPCQIRAHRARRSLQYAPPPPPEMTGKLAHGYTIEPDIVKKVICATIGEKKIGPQQTFSTFRWKCGQAISPTSNPKAPIFEVRDDAEEHDEGTLNNYLIAIASSTSRELPPEEEIGRLKAFLGTDAEPQWCAVI
ncbi:hypothetical protein SCHPADRAFT_1000416 [Schizopora paradoxa]|uniref:Uncharacterized protein n=1 Tax=Schizopora paradoxa TaxID=27342 RepID=A0A0H2RBL2_9AGAM|nr:hypothetical protein SCHPADRAFT_1000416 [Schizopora paradoxa]